MGLLDGIKRLFGGGAVVTSPPPSDGDSPPDARKSSLNDSQAERLARAIVSDIALYNGELVQKVRASGQLGPLQESVEEGRKLFLSRCGPEQLHLFEAAVQRQLTPTPAR